MLTAALPGVRELRTPLVIGYIWMLAAWLVWQEWFSGSERANDLIGPLRDLDDVVTALGAPIALSFVAYFVGSLSADAFAPLLVKPAIPPFIGSEVGRRAPGGRWARARRTTSIAAEERLRLRFGNQLYEGILEVGGGYGDGRPADDAQDDLVRFQHEVPDVTAELMEKRPDLYQEFDRHRAESNLRLAMIPPLLVLSLVLFVSVYPLWILVLVVLPMLYLQGLQRLRLSNDIVAEASLALGLRHAGIEAAIARAVAARREEL